MTTFNFQSFGYGVLCTLILAFFAFAITIYFSSSPPAPVGDPMEHKVDPWDLQRLLMKVSDQFRPPLPVLHKGALMYFALILEETSELAAGLFRTLEREWVNGIASASSTETELRSIMLWRLAHHSEFMHKLSVDIRDDLALMPDFEAHMTAEECVEILDGTTDIQVVNSGFALAAGLPGPAAYSETVTSNLSKANPATGKIDKDPSGKWIKGVDYRKPNLHRVLKEQQDVHDAAYGIDTGAPDHYIPLQTAL